ncbi:hypothetical protein LguiB_026513 [Lonicera macranthoides]
MSGNVSNLTNIRAVPAESATVVQEALVARPRNACSGLKKVSRNGESNLRSYAYAHSPNYFLMEKIVCNKESNKRKMLPASERIVHGLLKFVVDKHSNCLDKADADTFSLKGMLRRKNGINTQSIHETTIKTLTKASKQESVYIIKRSNSRKRSILQELRFLIPVSLLPS